MNSLLSERWRRQYNLVFFHIPAVLIALLIINIFNLYMSIPTTKNPAIFCPENVDPHYVVDKYHEYHLIKIIDKNTKEIKKSYGEDGMVRLRLLKDNTFMMEVRVIENPKKPHNNVLVMQKLDPNEYIDVETRYKNYENKEWGLK